MLTGRDNINNGGGVFQDAPVFVVPLGIYEQFGTIISKITVMVPTSIAQTSSFDLVDGAPA